jgi:hypothetical protein
MSQEIIDRLEYGYATEVSLAGQYYELWYDPKTETEYWVPVDKVYRWDSMQEKVDSWGESREKEG